MADEKRSRTWLWVLIGGGAFFLFVLAVFTLVYLTLHAGQQSSSSSFGGFGDKIGVVDLDGVIMDPGCGGRPAEEVCARMIPLKPSSFM